MRDLTVQLVQTELAWEQPAENRQQLQQLMEDAAPERDLIVLPEMFTTGFSMNALANAEEPGGATEQWLKSLATRFDCAITGSIAVNTDAGVCNRMLFATPEDCIHYDKRHLFRMGGEHRRYAAGNERVVVQWREWRILLLVCYDLRFPVFIRNRSDYDLAVCVANWPSARRAHWRALLAARAIENQACVAGVNRIGSDANGLTYAGDSLLFDARGTAELDLADNAVVSSATLSGADLLSYRDTFPCHADADSFELHL